MRKERKLYLWCEPGVLGNLDWMFPIYLRGDEYDYLSEKIKGTKYYFSDVPIGDVNGFHESDEYWYKPYGKRLFTFIQNFEFFKSRGIIINLDECYKTAVDKSLIMLSKIFKSSNDLQDFLQFFNSSSTRISSKMEDMCCEGIRFHNKTIEIDDFLIKIFPYLEEYRGHHFHRCGFNSQKTGGVLYGEISFSGFIE